MVVYDGDMASSRVTASIRTAWFIAIASLKKGSRSTAALLIFILALSFINLMFISGILSGFTHGIVQNLVNTYTSHITIDPQEVPRPKMYIPNQEDLRARIAAVPGVVATARHYALSGVISYDKDKKGIYKTVSAPVIGVDPAQERKVTTIANYMVDGSYLDGLKNNEIVLGAGLTGGYGLPEATDLGGVRAGDKVTVAYSNGIVHTYTVKGIYLVVIGSVANLAFISSREAESILSEYDKASKILVRADFSRSPLATIKANIEQIVPKLRVRTYKQLLALIGPILDAFDLISYIVTVISIIVAAITLFVLIYINALSKRRQIGVLRAIGINENIIIFSYVIQSLFYVICGVLLGMVIVFFVLEPYFRAHPIKLPIGDIVLVYTTTRVWGGIISLLVAGVLAGLIPAYLVAREEILKSIWG